MIIYSKGGVVLAEVAEAQYSGVFMGERFVSCSIKNEKPIDFLPDDYLVYRGENFVLEYTPTAKKISSSESTGDAFQYDLKFVSLKHELENCMFLDVVLNDNEIHYTGLSEVQFFGNALVLSHRILANLNRLYKGTQQWTIEVLKETETQSINLSNSNCWNALSQMKNLFNLNFTVVGRKITVGSVGKLVDHIFKYGSGNGLTEITRTAVSENAVVTRLRAYGGERNLPRDYNKTGLVPESQYIKSLMLPGYTETLIDYIDSENIPIYGIREAVFKDENIYPSIHGVTADDLKAAGVATTATGRVDEIVHVEAIQKDDQATFNVWIKDIGFDIKKYLTPTTALLSMRDGNLGGYEFEITNVVKDSSVVGASYKLTSNRNQDDNFILPDIKTFIKPGDHFVLLEIYMPEVYVKVAEQRLLTKAKEYLIEYDHLKSSYSLNMDKVFMAKHPTIGDKIYEGDLVHVVDKDLKLDVNIVIQNLNIKIGGTVPEYSITISDDPVATTLDRVQDDVSDIEHNVTANREDGVKEARRRSAELQLLKGNIFDPDGNIKDEFLQIMMLQVGANSMNYQMGITTARPNLVNMSFTNTSINLGKDKCIHFAYGAADEKASTWNIATPFSGSGLIAEKTYFVAIKASRDNLTAEWIVSENTFGSESVTGYYIFNFGILSEVKNGKRLFSETRGNIYGYGDELIAGIISSMDRYSYFNLNTGEFQLYDKKTGDGLQLKGGTLSFGSFNPETGKFGSSVSIIENSIKDVDNKATAAQQAADKAINDASKAQQAADSAAASAADSNIAISKLSDDNIISAIEKPSLKKEWDIIVSEKPLNISQATKFNVPSTVYVNAYNSLSNLIGSNLDFLNTDWEVNGATLRGSFKTYYDERTNLLNSISSKAKTLADNAQLSADDAQKDLNTYKGITNATLETLNAVTDDLQSQVDGNIMAFDGDYVPTLTNYPANTWTTDIEKTRHKGDYFDRTFLQGTEKVTERYKFVLNANIYSWVQIADSSSALALQEAREALGLAGTKAKLFYGNSIPTAPYDINDAWWKINGTTLLSNAKRSEGFGQLESDWKVVNDAQVRVAQMSSDNVISKEEKARLRNDKSQIEKEYIKYSQDATKYNVSIANLQSSYNSLISFLESTIKVAEDSDYTFTNMQQQTEYNQLFANYFTSRSEFSNIISKKITDDGVNNIQIGGVNLINGTDFITNTSAYLEGKNQHLVNILNDNRGKEITFSFDVDIKSNNNRVVFEIDVLGLDGKHYFIGCSYFGSNYKGRVKFSMAVYDIEYSSINGLYLINQTSFPENTCGHPQIEFGNKASDWSPSPADQRSETEHIAQLKSEAERVKAEAYADGKVTAEEKRAIADAQDKLNIAVTEAAKIALGNSWSGGKILYPDPTFKEGQTVGVYNNSGNGNVILTRIPKLADSPFDSGYNIEIKNIGVTSPYLGGFSFGNPSRANAIFICRFIAKIPVGYNVDFNTNAVGSNAKIFFTTSTRGTGKWEEYISVVKCGDSGAFGGTNYYAIEGAVGTPSAPVIWYLAYASVFDVTDGVNAQTLADSKPNTFIQTTLMDSARKGDTWYYGDTTENSDYIYACIKTFSGGYDVTAWALVADNTTMIMQKGMITTGTIFLRGADPDNKSSIKAGITGESTNGINAVRFWAGGTLEDAKRLVMNTEGVKASFAVTHGGKLFATSAEISGMINATSGKIGGFGISGESLTNEGFNNDATVIFRNDNDHTFAAIGGTVLPPSTGIKALLKISNEKYNPHSTNYGGIFSVSGGNKNIAIQIDNGGIVMERQGQILLKANNNSFIVEGVLQSRTDQSGSYPLGTFLADIHQVYDGYATLRIKIR